MDKLRLKLMASGMVHTVTLKQVKSTKKNKKIAAAAYLYQADNDGDSAHTELTGGKAAK